MIHYLTPEASLSHLETSKKMSKTCSALSQRAGTSTRAQQYASSLRHLKFCAHSLRSSDAEVSSFSFSYFILCVFVCAMLAMQRKPVVTEVRTPTDTWSGLGFSKSMPAEAVKELRNVSRRCYKPYLSTISGQQQQVTFKNC